MNRRDLLKSAGAVALAAPLANAAPISDEKRRLPPGFIWGTATSAYQVEGRAGRRADCIWDRFSRIPGEIDDASNGDIACDQPHFITRTWRTAAVSQASERSAASAFGSAPC